MNFTLWMSLILMSYGQFYMHLGNVWPFLYLDQATSLKCPVPDKLPQNGKSILTFVIGLMVYLTTMMVKPSASLTSYGTTLRQWTKTTCVCCSTYSYLFPISVWISLLQ